MTPILTRRGALRLAAAWPLAGTLPLRAQAVFPERPITVIVPFGPGGIADLTARTVTQAMSTTLKVPMVVVYGGADKIVDFDWIEQAIHRSCAAGSVIAWQKHAGQGHDNVDASWVFSWLRTRFAGDAASDNCAANQVESR